MSRSTKQDMTIGEFKQYLKKGRHDPDYGVPDPIEDEDTVDEMTISEFKDFLNNSGDFE